MSTNFSALAYSLRIASQIRGQSIKLGHAQQLLAAAFGYGSLAGYQHHLAVGDEPKQITAGCHLLLDVSFLRMRTDELELDFRGSELVEILVAAFAAQGLGPSVYDSNDKFFNVLHSKVEQAVINDENVSNHAANMNTSGVSEIYMPFDFAFDVLPEIGEIFEIEINGHLGMNPDEDRTYLGNTVEVVANLGMKRVGRRLVSDVRVRITSARPDDSWVDSWPRGPLRSRASAFGELLGIDPALLTDLSNYSVWEDTGSSGEGSYGSVIDFTDADPESVVQLIMEKHGTLSFNVPNGFFDNLESEDE